MSGASGSPEQSWLTFNSEDFFDYLTSDAVIELMDNPESVRELIAGNDGHTMHQVPWTYEINETLKAIYTDFHFEGELTDMPWSITTGLRYVKATSNADGFAVPLLELAISTSKPGFVNAIAGDDYAPVSVKHDYDNWLPSVNAKIEIVEDVIARFAYSKSISRPELDEMSPESGYAGGAINNLTGWGH